MFIYNILGLLLKNIVELHMHLNKDGLLLILKSLILELVEGIVLNLVT